MSVAETLMSDGERSEKEVFGELLALTSSPGYVHAIAHICVRDNLVIYQKEMKTVDLEKMFGNDRLNRNEITTLLGLMARSELDLTLPAEGTIQTYVERTDRLMAELHDAMQLPTMLAMRDAIHTGNLEAELWKGAAFREPIFYGAESAYSFQYRDFVSEKYGEDDQWFIENKGFSINEGREVARAMCALLDEKATSAYEEMRRSGFALRSWLPTFEQSPEEISNRSGVQLSRVQAFLDAFSMKGFNETFQSLGDFNAATVAPVILTKSGGVLLFQHYAIYEALYESPAHWMWTDEKYRNTASRHKGEFTENFSARRLEHVFGRENVYSNVQVVRKKGDAPGEIDVLVVYGDRMIVVQAKSKKLTLEARKGNDGILRKDFAAAIQDSYDQGWLCANAIVDGTCRLVDVSGHEISLKHPPKEVFIVNVVSEHYPALAFQVQQFLNYQETERIRPPFVMDVFLLDALTEMLATPLRLLSYVRMRVGVIDRLSLSHEFTALGFHLKRNMWLESDFDQVMLDDSISVDLDLAMMVRREGIPGEATPPGILTRLRGSLYERIVSQLEERAEPAALELGFSLLEMAEESSRNVHFGLDAITRRSRQDGKPHDFTIGSAERGICFQCNPAPSMETAAALRIHCMRRKYKERAPLWFGVSVDTNANLQFCFVLSYEWERSEPMEAATQGMKTGVPGGALRQLARSARKVKVGRNDPCPCGSGQKFKRCCLQ